MQKSAIGLPGRDWRGWYLLPWQGLIRHCVNSERTYNHMPRALPERGARDPRWFLVETPYTLCSCILEEQEIWGDFSTPSTKKINNSKSVYLTNKCSSSYSNKTKIQKQIDLNTIISIRDYFIKNPTFIQKGEQYVKEFVKLRNSTQQVVNTRVLLDRK